MEFDFGVTMGAKSLGKLIPCYSIDTPKTWVQQLYWGKKVKASSETIKVPVREKRKFHRMLAQLF